MGEVLCAGCNQKREHHAKGMCYGCYRKLNWQPPKGICKRCGRDRIIHAKSLCKGCYNSVFSIEATKAYNRRKYFNLANDEYKKLTRKCAACGFDKIVDLHHLDHNKLNNNPSNLVPVCPNHHRMLHHRDLRKEVCVVLEQKGFKIPERYAEDSVFKNA